MIDKEEVKKLAHLSRIELSGEDVERHREEIEAILSYISRITEVEGAQEERLGPLTNVFRDDAHPHETGMHTETLLSQAPHRSGDHISVKKVISQ